MVTTSFEQLYKSLFPRGVQDRLDNYSHVRLLRPSNAIKSTRLDVVRSIAGPASRRNGSDLCVLMCIPVPQDNIKAQHQILKQVSIHRSVSLGSDPIEERILPLLSHFVSPRIFGSTQRRDTVAEAYLVLVLPYCPKGSLADFVVERLASQSVFEEKKVLEESELRWTILELTKALRRCHERGIVHRNIEPEHVILWHKRVEESSPKKQADGPMQLLLSGFGQSSWIDEIHTGPDDGGESTLCEIEDHKSRTKGNCDAVYAFGRLCVFLLTGDLQDQQLDDERSTSSSLSDVRVEEKPSGTPGEVQRKSPPGISRPCRSLIEGMLEKDEKRRLTIDSVLSHPFMRCSRPLEPLENAKIGAIFPRAKVDTPTADRSKSVASNLEGSSTTLRSVMQRISPTIFLPAEGSKVEKRKTPFGVVRIAKEGSEGDNLVRATSWGNGYGTRGLTCVRQRIKGGKIQIMRDGQVVVAIDDAFLAISASGALLTTRLQGDTRADELYLAAARWLKVYRQKCTLAGFMLPAVQDSPDHHPKPKGAVEYLGYCSIKGNGPYPDYEVRFAAAEEGTKSHDEWNVQVQVQIQRDQSRMRLLTQLQSTGKRVESSSKETVLGIKASRKHGASHWLLAGNAKTSVIIRELSEREIRAVERSLQASQSVDSIFNSLMCG